MEIKEILKLALKRKKTIALITFLVLFISFMITVVQPLKYRATTKILITQNFGATLDAYTISRSNQFISNVLSQVVYSDTFFDDVLNSGYNIQNNIFSKDPTKRKKQWDKMNKTRVINDAGMIVIYTYYQDKPQAVKINEAIAYTLRTKHNKYHGLGNKIDLKIIDKTLTTKYPVKPNIIINAILGIILGLFFSGFYIYKYPNGNLSLLVKNKKRKEENDFSQIEEEINLDQEVDLDIEKEVHGALFGVPSVMETMENEKEFEDFSDDAYDNNNHEDEKENELEQDKEYAVKGSMGNILRQ